jgi:amidophosphoribosyltransferase
MREIIGADSLTFLSVEGTLEAVGRKDPSENRGQCLACFTGKYPTEIYPDTLHPYEKELVR